MWIQTGSGWDTSWLMGCGHLGHLEMSLGGSRTAQNGPIMAKPTPLRSYLGRFGPFQSPPMTFSDGPNGPNPSARMCPTQIQSGSTWIHQFWGSMATYGQTYPIEAIIGPFGPFQSPPMTLPDGPNGPNPSARMCPTQIQSGSTWIHQ